MRDPPVSMLPVHYYARFHWTRVHIELTSSFSIAIVARHLNTCPEAPKLSMMVETAHSPNPEPTALQDRGIAI